MTTPARAGICPAARTIAAHRQTAPRHAGSPRRLTPRQLAAVRTVMRLFVEEDLDNGVPPQARLDCCACARSRPMPGFVRYGDYQFCNTCATDYELARLAGMAETPDVFVRGSAVRDADAV